MMVPIHALQWYRFADTVSQQQMAELFATSKPNISMHIANILKEKELNEISVVKKFLTTAADGKNYMLSSTH